MRERTGSARDGATEGDEEAGWWEDGPPPMVLSRRQAVVLGLAAAGCTQAEIARRLGLQPATVREHLARARRQLGARSTVHAAVVALARGLIEVE